MHHILLCMDQQKGNQDKNRKVVVMLSLTNSTYIQTHSFWPHKRTVQCVAVVCASSRIILESIATQNSIAMIIGRKGVYARPKFDSQIRQSRAFGMDYACFPSVCMVSSSSTKTCVCSSLHSATDWRMIIANVSGEEFKQLYHTTNVIVYSRTSILINDQ